jgi:predicted ATPase
MVQTLLEEGVVQRNGRLKLDKPISAVRVPASVQAVLASRIDRLAGADKELLQTLAVLRRDFPLNLVQRVILASSDKLGRMLAQLQLGEFIYEQPVVGEVEYSFKHPLDAGGRLQFTSGRTPPHASRTDGTRDSKSFTHTAVFDRAAR